MTVPGKYRSGPFMIYISKIRSNSFETNRQIRPFSISFECSFLFLIFLLGIFLIYISNAIPTVPYIPPCPAPLPTLSYFLALVFPCTEAYKVCTTNGPLFPMMAN
jgi:hypothetical protein